MVDDRLAGGPVVQPLIARLASSFALNHRLARGLRITRQSMPEDPRVREAARLRTGPCAMIPISGIEAGGC